MVDNVLTPEEMKCLFALAGVWNMFIALPVQHSLEQQEFMYAIHLAENAILVRPTIRALKGKRIVDKP